MRSIVIIFFSVTLCMITLSILKSDDVEFADFKSEQNDDTTSYFDDNSNWDVENIDSAKKAYLKHYSEFIKKQTFPSYKGYNTDSDYVPNEETAIKIAEAVWLPIYGSRIYKFRPFVAVLAKNNKEWRVFGMLPRFHNGRTPFAFIRKSDGKILSVFFN